MRPSWSLILEDQKREEEERRREEVEEEEEEEEDERYRNYLSMELLYRWLCFCMEYYGFVWISIDCYDLVWNSMGFVWILVCFISRV